MGRGGGIPYEARRAEQHEAAQRDTGEYGGAIKGAIPAPACLQQKWQRPRASMRRCSQRSRGMALPLSSTRRCHGSPSASPCRQASRWANTGEAQSVRRSWYERAKGLGATGLRQGQPAGRGPAHHACQGVCLLVALGHIKQAGGGLPLQLRLPPPAPAGAHGRRHRDAGPGELRRLLLLRRRKRRCLGRGCRRCCLGSCRLWRCWLRRRLRLYRARGRCI